MCCRHYKAYIRGFFIFCSSRQICFLVFWSNMAVSTCCQPLLLVNALSKPIGPAIKIFFLKNSMFCEQFRSDWNFFYALNTLPLPYPFLFPNSNLLHFTEVVTMAMAHHEKLAKRQMFRDFWVCLCRSAAHLKQKLLFSWWHHFIKIKACLLFVQGPSAPFLSGGLFKMRKWEGCLHWLSREPNSSPPFFLFLILWFTDLFLHMRSFRHSIASFQAVRCFQLSMTASH